MYHHDALSHCSLCESCGPTLLALAVFILPIVYSEQLLPTVLEVVGLLLYLCLMHNNRFDQGTIVFCLGHPGMTNSFSVVHIGGPKVA